MNGRVCIEFAVPPPTQQGRPRILLILFYYYLLLIQYSNRGSALQSIGVCFTNSLPSETTTSGILDMHGGQNEVNQVISYEMVTILTLPESFIICQFYR